MSVPAPTSGGTRPLYTPLQPGQIRILRLHPAAAPEASIKGDLLQADLADGSDPTLSINGDLFAFEAISYAWGSPSAFTDSILCNDLLVHLAPTLGAALRCFRLLDRERYLWVDFLCVNQLDTAEKNVQVANMFDIYRRAQQVLAWLGDEGPYTPAAMKYLALLSHYTEEEVDRRSRVWTAETTLNLGLFDIYCRPWNRRAWVRQEVFAARQITVFLGHHELDFDVYKNQGDALYSDLQRGLYHHSGMDTNLIRFSLRSLEGLTRADEISIARLQSERQAYLDLDFRWHANDSSAKEEFPALTADLSHRFESIMEENMWLEASEPKDLVYALLSLTYCPVLLAEPAYDRHPLGIRLDYAKSYDRVLQDVTKFILNRDKSLHILKHRSFAPAKWWGLAWDDQALPSWTVDWRGDFKCKYCDDRSRHRSNAPLRWQDPSECGTVSLWGIKLTVIESFYKAWDNVKGLDDGTRMIHLFMRARTHLRVVPHQTSSLPRPRAHQQKPMQVRWSHAPKLIPYKRVLPDAKNMDEFDDLWHRGLVVVVLVEGIAADEVVYLQSHHDERFSYLRNGTLSEHFSLVLSDLQQDMGTWNGEDLFEATKASHRKFIIR
ncbi:hypothetical protein LTR17_019310 [Elasticomyces elasticus]|nr:hypothetical protein LTR17_019310 [Elasticomyces elasticus]